MDDQAQNPQCPATPNNHGSARVGKPWMKTLMDEASGRFEVKTESGSKYWLDLDHQLMSRTPTSDDPGGAAHGLRRDGSAVRLLRVVECTVGRSMHLLIDLSVPGVDATTRRTTTVTAIEPLAHDLERTREES